MSKFLEYVNHVQTINEAISHENYRDNQIGKIVDGKAVFVDNFLDKVIHFLQSFPFQGERESVGPIGDDYGNYRDPDYDDEDYEDEEDFYNIDNKSIDQFDTKYFVKPGEQYDLKKHSIHNRFPRHNYNYIDVDQIKQYINLTNKILNIKNKKTTVAEAKSVFGTKNNIDKIVERINSNTSTAEDILMINNFIYVNVLKKTFGNFLTTRGTNKNIWLISPIKDAIYDTNLRDLVSKKSKIKANLAKKIEDKIAKHEEEIKKITETGVKLTEAKKKKIEKLREEIKLNQDEIENIKKSESTNLISIKESITKTIELFKSIKRQMNDKAVNEFDKVISWRKLIFDYNNLTTSSLSNEILKDRKYVIDFLVDLDFKINELEFDVGYVTPPEDYVYDNGKEQGSPINFSEVIIYLKVKSNEIKPKDETKLNKLLDELNIKKGVNYTDFASLKFFINDILSGNRFSSMKEKDLIDTFNDQALIGKDNKDLLAWANTNKKTKEMQALVKRYDRNKYMQLLAMVKTFMNKSKEEYQKAINVINNPKIMGANTKLKIIFTLSPRAFLSQSTRANLKNGITSCMNMFFGCNRRYVPTSLAGGAFTAYLVRVNKDNSMTGNSVVDSKIIDPIARVVIKPFKTNQNSQDIYWFPDRPYVDGASKIDKNEFNLKVKSILNRYHNASLPEGSYNMKEGHYADSINNFKLDKLFKIINSEDNIKEFKRKLAILDAEAIKDFKEILSTNGDNIFSLWGNDPFPPTPDKKILISSDVRALPPGINCETLTINTQTLQRLPDDLKCQKLDLNQSSKITSLSNLKHIAETEEIGLYNSETAIGNNLLNSEKIKKLFFSDNNINLNTTKEINLPNAHVKVSKRDKNLPKNIICEIFEIREVSNFDILKDMKIKCKKFIFSAISAKDSDFLILKNLIEKNLETESIDLTTRIMSGVFELDLSKIKDEINVNIEKLNKIIFPTELKSLTLTSYEGSIPSEELFWEKLYGYKFSKCKLLLNPVILKCKKIFTDIFTGNGNFNYKDFYYINEAKKISYFNNLKELKEILKKGDLKIDYIADIVLNNKISAELIERINSGTPVINSLVIDLRENDSILKTLKDKKINISNYTKINISIKDNVKYNFNIVFFDEPDTINTNITINVDKDVDVIDISKLFNSNKSLIMIYKDVEQSEYDDISFKVISQTPYNVINKNFNGKIVPLSLSRMDAKSKLNIVDNMAYNIKFDMKDIKKTFDLTDYFNISKEKNRNIKINVHIYEIYHEMFKRLKLDYKKLLDLSSLSDETAINTEVEQIKNKIDTMVSTVDFNITGFEEFDKNNIKLKIDFYNIFFNDKKFCEQNKIDIKDMPEIKKQVIQKYKLNAHLITKLYEKMIEKIDNKNIEDADQRPKIVASKQGDSYLPEL